MLAIQPDSETEKRLALAAKQTCLSEVLIAREAILRHVEELEDIRLVQGRLLQASTTFSADEVERELGF